MLIEYSKIVGLPVFDLETQEQLTQVVDLIIDEDNVSVKAFLVQKSGFFAKKQIVVFKEIVDLSKQAVLIHNANNITDPNEIVRIGKKMNLRARIIAEDVVTKNGEKVGKVYDYVIDSETGGLIRLYVKRFFDEKIIHSSAIEKIERNKITIKDNFEKTKSTILVSENKIGLA